MVIFLCKKYGKKMGWGDGGGRELWGCSSQDFPELDFLPMVNDKEKKKAAKKYQPFQIP